MKSTPRSILKQVFGYEDFREHQKEIIDTVTGGQDAFVLMPTGSGKSICYQIPAILNKGIGIVISPLIALMEDQVAALNQNGASAAFLNSSLTPDEARRTRRRILDNAIDVLYVAPERLLMPEFRQLIGRITPALFAIDEAHCVSQWGHDFRPEYLRITEVTRLFPGVPRLALTATADRVTRRDILEKLDLQHARVFISSFDRPNITYRVQVKAREKQMLRDFIDAEHPAGAGIVYVRTRKRAESIAAWLAERGIAALPYHAGLPAPVRLDHQKRFQENAIRVIVATIAFGMGIDKPDVRFVAHLDLPASMEAYYQETGRAGRDDQPADAWMVYALADVMAMRRLFEQSDGSDAYKRIQRGKLDALLGYCESVKCRRQLLLNYFGEDHDGACGNCSNCLTPPETWDGTVAAQKALSCVYRTGQRFGAAHLANVLTGTPTEQVERWGHDRIKTFGIGQDLDRRTWMSVFRQLLSAGYLSVELGRISGLRLTEASRPVLRGEEDVLFRKDLAASGAPRAPATSRQEDIHLADDDSRSLFEQLRQLRLDIARHLDVPPYVVFHDRSLKEMAVKRPESPAAFFDITGVGTAKADRYATVFLKCIRGEDVNIPGDLKTSP